MLIPYHASRLFDIWEPFYVKNAQTSFGLTLLRATVDPWGMALLFVISGAGTFFSLQRRTGREFLRRRVLRLVVPLVFGLLLVVPPQAYFAWIAHGHQGSYGAFLQEYWRFDTGEIMGWDGGFTVAHLWFLLWLISISMVTLPLLVFLRREAGIRFVQWLAKGLHKPGVLLAVVIPFWMTDPLPGPLVGNLNPFSYVFLFIAGFLLVADERIQTALDRCWRLALGLGTVSVAAWATIRFSGIELAESSWQSSVRDFFFYFTSWSWIIGLLGFGHTYLNRSGRALAYLGKASYPYYVIHQTVIVALGFYVIQMDIGIPLKYGLIVTLAAAATFGTYELARRWSLTRAVLAIRAPKPADGA